MEKETTKRTNVILEGFIVYPSPDDGPYFLKTDGLSESEIEPVIFALQRKEETGYDDTLQTLIAAFENQGRLVALAGFVDPFIQSNKPIRLRLLIEELAEAR